MNVLRKGESMPKVKAYGYINSLETENNTQEKQEHAIKRYATARNIEIVRFYQESLSARNTLRPPALSELLLDLEDNDYGIRTLLVERLDRLARDLTVQSAIVSELRSQGFEVISALEGSLYRS